MAKAEKKSGLKPVSEADAAKEPSELINLVAEEPKAEPKDEAPKAEPKAKKAKAPILKKYLKFQ